MVPLFDLPHAETRRLLAEGVPVYLFVNPVEYHGPHLSLHTDRLLSQGLARDLHERLAKQHPTWPLLVADDLEVGQGATVGPGTRSTPYRVVRQLVHQACQSLVQLGAQRVVIMTFHGAPLHNLAIDAGVQELRRQGVRALSPFNVVLREMVRLRDVRIYAPALEHVPPDTASTVLNRLLRDFHAGFFETSLALHYAPASVSPIYKVLPPCPDVAPDRRLAAAAHAAERVGALLLADELRFAAWAMAWQALRPFPGYTGEPSWACAEAGAFFARLILERYVPVVVDVLAGRAGAPAPIMPWLEKASLGGWLGDRPIGADPKV